MVNAVPKQNLNSMHTLLVCTYNIYQKTRLFFVFSMFCYSTLAQGQDTLSYLTCQHILTQKVNDIQLKIWEGVIEQKINAYLDQELDSLISVSTILAKCAGVDAAEQREQAELFSSHKKNVQKQEKPDSSLEYKDSWFSDTHFDHAYGNQFSWTSTIDLIDSAIWARERKWEQEEMEAYNLKEEYVTRYDFIPTRDLKGLSFNFGIVRGNLTISHTLKSVGILVDFQTLSGILFSNEKVFCVKYKDLEEVLSTKELSFLIALAQQRSGLGDFVPEHVYLEEGLNLDAKLAGMNFNRFTNRVSQNCLQRDIALLAKYNAETFHAIGMHIAESEQINQSEFLFSTKKLTKPYKNIEYQLMSEDTFTFEMDGLLMTYAGTFSFSHLQEAVVEATENDDFIISYQYETKEVNAFFKPITLKTELKYIYISYNKVKQFIKPHDRYILEFIMNELID